VGSAEAAGADNPRPAEAAGADNPALCFGAAATMIIAVVVIAVLVI
jgi:hypothetical protein